MSDPDDIGVPDPSEIVDDALTVDASVISTGPTTICGYAVPDGALRVRVVDEKGAIAWRPIDKVLSTDTIDLTDKGQPQWMFNPVGRPSKKKQIESLPPVTPVVGQLIEIKEAHIRTDPVILAAEATPESPDVLNQVMLAIAEESASLRFERLEAERTGQETSHLSMRRVAALKAIGDTWIKRKEQIQNREIDMESPSFQELFRFISETFARAMQAAGVRQEQADTVFAKFASLLDDEWKKEAKNRMVK